jgi:uncharacterized protein
MDSTGAHPGVCGLGLVGLARRPLGENAELTPPKRRHVFLSKPSAQRPNVQRQAKSTNSPSLQSTIASARSNVSRMKLQERVDSDLKDAMRAKEATKLGVLRMLKSALKYAAIEKSGADTDLSEAEAIQVIRKQVKQRQDSIESFEKGGRAELAAKEKEELSVLNAYLPQAMSADEVSQIVRETIAAVGATSKAQMGLVMKAAQAKADGRVDGKTLSQEVQKQLSG